MIDLEHFILQENPDSHDYVVGTYLLLRPVKDSKEIVKVAIMMATEQTTGTWVSVPGETRDIIAKHRAKIIHIWEVPDREQVHNTPEQACTFILQIAFPWDNFGPQLPMLLTTLLCL